MAREAVNLVKQKVKGKNSTYIYWYLRWFGSDGKFHGKSIGRIDKILKREAEKLRLQKQIELFEQPGRRNISRACILSEYLNSYFDSRKSELAEGTYRLHKYTERYLLAFFGEGRRIDQISRADARVFKTALTKGELKYINRKKRDLTATTVDLYIRNSRSMFNNAVTDDVIPYNPFDKVSKPPKLDKAWHYVTPEEYKKLTDHATPNIQLLISLCRLAALRRGEALALEWSNIDWLNNRLTVITKEDRSWQPKDKDSRIVPIFPELQTILLVAHENAPEGQVRVIEGAAKQLLERLSGLISKVRRSKVQQAISQLEKRLYPGLGR